MEKVIDYQYASGGKVKTVTSRPMVTGSNSYSEPFLCSVVCVYGRHGRKMASSVHLLSRTEGVLGARLPGTDEVTFGLDDAPTFDDNGVAQDPLQLPVSHVHILRPLLQCLPECSS